MAHAHLITAKGARLVTRAELDCIEPPPATTTWRPIKHADLLDTVSRALEAAGFQIRGVQAALSRHHQRLFATLDTATHLNGGSVTLAAALVNSTDRSLPMKFLAGNRVLCCMNLALRSDLMEPVRKKHTRKGLEAFRLALAEAIVHLEQFRSVESARIQRCHAIPLTDTEAEALMLRAYERGIVSHRLLPEFAPRTLWSLENCFTGVLHQVQTTNPQRFCDQSLLLQALLGEVAEAEASAKTPDAA
jgi:hypothetical protein